MEKRLHIVAIQETKIASIESRTSDLWTSDIHRILASVNRLSKGIARPAPAERIAPRFARRSAVTELASPALRAVEDSQFLAM